MSLTIQQATMQLNEAISYSTVHRLVWKWIDEGKIRFSGSLSSEDTDDLDPIIFKLCGIDYNDDVRTSAQLNRFVYEADVAWAFNPHAFALFRAKCIKLGITDFDQQS